MASHNIRYATPGQSQGTPGASQDALARTKTHLQQSTNYAVAISNLTVNGLNSPFRHRIRAPIQQGPPPPPPSVPIPDPPILKTVPDPDEPIQCQHQLDMLKAFDAEGRYGLMLAIYAEALAQRAQHGGEKNSWNYLLADQEPDANGNIPGRVYQLLMLLPDYIIRSLIRNTITYDFYQDSRVHKFVTSDMLASNMPSRAGIYANVLHKTPSGQQLLIQDKTDLGKWLTHKQVKRLIERVRTYLDNKSDSASLKANLRIDGAFISNFNPRDPLERRFLPAKDSTSWNRVLEWLLVLESQFCDQIDPSDVNKPFVRCPFEVGWAQNTTKRLKQHDNNSGTTTLFAYANAITRMRRSDGGADFGPPMQLILFPIWEDDLHLKQVAEVLGSVLCSSYWLYGGLNYELAGYSVGSTKTVLDDEFYNSTRDVYQRFLDDFLDEDLKGVFDRAEDANKSFMKPQLVDEEQVLRRSVEEKAREIRELREELQKARTTRMEDRRIQEAKHMDSLKRAKEEDEAFVEEFEAIRKSVTDEGYVREAMDLINQSAKARAKGEEDVVADILKALEEYDEQIIRSALGGLRKIDREIDHAKRP